MAKCPKCGEEIETLDCSEAVIAYYSFDEDGNYKFEDWGDTLEKNDGYFCPECGSSTHGMTAGFPGMITVRAAILDQTDELAPQVTVYKKRLRDWDQLADNAPAFDAMPPAEAAPAE